MNMLYILIIITNTYYSQSIIIPEPDLQTCKVAMTFLAQQGSVRSASCKQVGTP